MESRLFALELRLQELSTLLRGVTLEVQSIREGLLYPGESEREPEPAASSYQPPPSHPSQPVPPYPSPPPVHEPVLSEIGRLIIITPRPPHLPIVHKYYVVFIANETGAAGIYADYKRYANSVRDMSKSWAGGRFKIPFDPNTSSKSVMSWEEGLRLWFEKFGCRAPPPTYCL